MEATSLEAWECQNICEESTFVDGVRGLSAGAGKALRRSVGEIPDWLCGVGKWDLTQRLRGFSDGF